MVAFERNKTTGRAGNEAAHLAGTILLIATGAEAQYAGSYGTGSNPSSHSVEGRTTSSRTHVHPLRGYQSEQPSAG
jgi:hypothetical protein